MRDWFYRISLLVVGIFVAYLIVFRGFITWVQYAPNTAISFVESVTHSKIHVGSIRANQTWLGVNFDVRDVQYDDGSNRLVLQKLSGDFNLFSPWVPQLKYGQRLEISGLTADLKSQTTPSLQSEDFTNFSDRVKDWHLQKLWKSIKIDDTKLTFHQAKPFSVGIKLFQSFFGLKWTFVGLVEVVTDEEIENQLQIKGDFATNLWSLPESGSGSVSILKPVRLHDIYHFLSDKVVARLPTGELIGDVRFRLKQGKLTHLRTYATVQDLVWPAHDRLLPKSIGLTLKLKSRNSSFGRSYADWMFELEKLRFDDQYIQTISPIYLSLTKNQNLSFSAQKFKLHEIKPLFDVALHSVEYQGVGKELKELELQKVAGVFNLKEVSLSKLTFQLPSFRLEPQEAIPGLMIKGLSFNKEKNRVQIRVADPIELTSKYIKSEPIRFVFPNTIHLETKVGVEKVWKLTKTKFTVDDMPATILASGLSGGGVDANLTIVPGTVKKVKAYLPYSIMSKPLEKWLKEALVAGDDVHGTAHFKGKFKDFPFKNGAGFFKAEAYVKNTELKFQPNWPAVKNFAAKLEFTPYDLKISSPKAQLMNVGVSDIRVDINQLDTKNIAVNIAGKAQSDAQDVLNFIQQTPLATKLGVKQFLGSQLVSHGNVSVDLKKIWVPVYGYAKKSESVNGTVQLNNVDATLFDQLALNKLNGELVFNEKKVSSKKPITGHFLSGDLSAEVQTNQHQVIISSSGNAQPDNQYMQGDFPWHIQVNVPLKKEQPVKIAIGSDMANVKSRMPAPFDQFVLDSKHKSNFILDMNVQKNNVQARGSIGGLANFYTDWNTDKSTPKNLKLILGDKTEGFPLPFKGYSVQGQVDMFDVDGWNHLLAQTVHSEKPSDKVLWKASSLNVGKLKLGGHVFNHVFMNWDSVKRPSQKERYLAFKLKADETSLVLTKSDSDAFNVNLSFLKLGDAKKEKPKSVVVLKKKAPAEIKSKSDVEPTCAAHENPINLPKIHFTGNNIQLDGRRISKLSFKLSDSDKEIVLSDLNAKFSRLHASLTGKYRYDKQKNLSYLDGGIQASNVEQLSELLGVHKGFKGKDGRLNMNLSWSGAYDCYSPISIKGKVDFSLKDGVIVNAEPGIARVLGLLSFQSLARRLKLDMTDVTDKGLVYDSISGEGEFDRGVFDLRKLHLKAPAASASVFGQINLIQKDMSLKAEITPAIGESIPALVALSGFATPLAGLAAYALLKAVPIVNQDLVTYRYEVTGGFDKPLIKDKGLNLDLIKLKGQSSTQENPLLESQ
ncbi:YhdP family phospholipid transporter [Hydrogenovibrio kuenenii]|uniref:YhdP family phospholipid transporter n=1 Tax=Hydrogenovibrio kuenenii TaxID=63658 RepID=UPI0004661671|nr:DUF3971 domain-containing protein [Hydrogenovibrio kuenenii]